MVTTPPETRLKTWQQASWEEFVRYCEDPDLEDVRAFYDEGLLWVDMGNEGLNHSSFCQLFSMIFGFGFAQPGQADFSNLGGCVLEKPRQ